MVLVLPDALDVVDTLTIDTLDRDGRPLRAATDLESALAACIPFGGVRVAVSSPDGALVAVRIGKRTLVRQVAEISGQAGSRLGTGRWLEMRDVAPTVAWRAA